MVNSLQRGLSILGAFTPEHPRLKFQQLAQKTKLPKATVFRLLRALHSLGYILFDPESKYYFLSPRVMGLGFTVLSSMDLREIAIPYLEELSRVANQNVNLGILDGTELIYIERVRKHKILNIDFHVGTRLNAYRTAAGRAILAFMDQEQFYVVLREILKETEAEKHIGPEGKRLVKLLQEVRHNGYSLSDEEYVKGVRAIGAPVFNNKGNVEAAINIQVFAHAVSRAELIERYVPMLLSAAEKISAARGFIKHSKRRGSIVKQRIATIGLRHKSPPKKNDEAERQNGRSMLPTPYNSARERKDGG
jgi:IclR family pca regulon transcriptional regulator